MPRREKSSGDILEEQGWRSCWILIARRVRSEELPGRAWEILGTMSREVLMLSGKVLFFGLCGCVEVSKTWGVLEV